MMNLSMTVPGSRLKEPLTTHITGILTTENMTLDVGLQTHGRGESGPAGRPRAPVLLDDGRLVSNLPVADH